MPLDSQDFELIKTLRKAVRDGNERTARLLQRMIERQDADAATQKEMLAAFNRVADNLAALTDAVNGLREDLTPKMDKPTLRRPPAAKKSGKETTP